MQHASKFLFPLLLLVSTNGYSSSVVNQYLGQVQYLSSSRQESITGESGWLDQPELRFSGSDDDEHGIAFRFRPRFASERLAQDRVLSLLNRRHNGALNAQLNDELEMRYHRIIELIGAYTDLDYAEQRLGVSRQQLALSQTLAQTEGFRIADLQAAELEYHRGQQRLAQLGKRLDNRLKSITGLSPIKLKEFLTDWSFQVNDWDGLLSVANKLVLMTNDNRMVSQEDQVDFELAQQKLRLARSESANWLKFVELKLVDRPSGGQETTLGLSIPLGKDHFDISQRAAEVNRANLSLQANKLRLSRLTADSVQELEWLRDESLAMESSWALLQQQYAKLRSSGQPALVLKLKSELLHYQNELKRQHISALHRYIELLHSTGYLAQQPLRNWLIQAQPTL